jgi:nucleoside-diphosphate-sugar epimerase
MRFAWLRLFSSYGPGDNPTWLIPSLIQKLRNGGKPALTRCEQLWDFLYVEDAADAVIQVALNEHAKGAFNLASGSARPLREIVETIRNSVAPNASLGFGEIAYRPDQVMRLEADIGRLSQATGWRPHTSLSEGIRLTMDSFGKS